MIRTAVSNYIQFGEKQGTTSVQFKNLLVNKKKAETFILDGVHVREDERDHVESMKLDFKHISAGKKSFTHVDNISY